MKTRVHSDMIIEKTDIERFERFLGEKFLFVPSAGDKKFPSIKWRELKIIDRDYILKKHFPSKGALMVIDKNIVIIDVDKDEYFSAVEMEFPATLTVKSPHGYHFYLKVNPFKKMRDTRRKIDLLSAGVIKIPGNPGYSYLKRIPVMNFSLEEFTEKINRVFSNLKMKGFELREPKKIIPTKDRSFTEYDRKMTVREIGKMMKVGSRHYLIRMFAYKLFEEGFKSDEIIGVIHESMETADVLSDEYDIYEIQRNVLDIEARLDKNSDMEGDD